MEGLSPTARVATAVLPFVLAMMLRISTGKSKTADWLITIATVWFSTDVLMAPYSAGMLRGIRDLGRLLP